MKSLSMDQQMLLSSSAAEVGPVPAKRASLSGKGCSDLKEVNMKSFGFGQSLLDK